MATLERKNQFELENLEPRILLSADPLAEIVSDAYRSTGLTEQFETSANQLNFNADYQTSDLLAIPNYLADLVADLDEREEEEEPGLEEKLDPASDPNSLTDSDTNDTADQLENDSPFAPEDHDSQVPKPIAAASTDSDLQSTGDAC